MADKIYDPENTERLEELTTRLAALGHAMQTGVAFMMEHDPGSTQPKHLRVGVNTAMVEHAALVNILVEKGLFTYEEYLERACLFMQREIDLYQAELSKAMGGAAITLR